LISFRSSKSANFALACITVVSAFIPVKCIKRFQFLASSTNLFCNHLASFQAIKSPLLVTSPAGRQSH
jgi:hypothetical protein